MLAVKLHKRKRVFLGRGSYFVPILNWETGRVYVRNWIQILNRSNRSGRNNCIRFISLIKLPGNCRVGLFDDWFNFGLSTFHEVPTFREVEQEIKSKLYRWREFHSSRISAAGMDYCDPGKDIPSMSWEVPELILGEALPRACVKWTKDIRLLHRGDKRKMRSRKYA